MVRGSLILFVTFSLAVGGLLFWQWQAYSENQNQHQEEIQDLAQQQIIIEAEAKEYRITQIFNGLKHGKEYRIIMPENHPKWSCTKEDDLPCPSKDENSETFLASKGKLQITYSIPIKENAAFTYFKDWTGRLHHVDITHSRVQIIDTAKRNGAWVAGLPLQGYKKMEFIDYYVFAGKGDGVGLYWQQKPLYSYKLSNALTIYSEQPNFKFKGHLSKLENIPEVPYFSLVQSSVHPPFSENGITLMGEIPTVPIIEREAASQYFAEKMPENGLRFSPVIDVLASMVLDTMAQTPKGQFIMGELKRNLSSRELLQFEKKVISMKKIEASNLDQSLLEIKGLKNSFFTNILAYPAKQKPLYFFDPRDIKLNGKLNGKLEIIYEQERRLFPLSETMQSLGYKVKLLPEADAVDLDNGLNSYRFYLNRNIFSQNQSEYGLLENPLTKKDGMIYIDQNGLQSLFKVNIEETEKEVILSI